MEVSIRRDRGQDPSNRDCPDHIGAVGTYAPLHQLEFDLQMTKVALATECYLGLYEEGEGEISMSFALSFQ